MITKAFSLITLLCLLVGQLALAVPSTKVRVIFFGIKPTIEKRKDAEFCKDYTPNKLDTRLDKMIHHNVKARNGVNLRFNSYHLLRTGQVYSLASSMEFSGLEGSEPWTRRAVVQGFSLENDGTLYAAWYDKRCKGFFRIMKMS